MKILKVWMCFLVVILLSLYISNTGILSDLIDSMLNQEYYMYSFFDDKEIVFMITFSSFLSCVAISYEFTVIHRKNDELQKEVCELKNQIDELSKK